MAKKYEHVHLGDGVYALYDGYGIQLRVNDHRSPVVVYLDPSVLKSLNGYFEKCKKSDSDE